MKTAKEKAEELIDKFKIYSNDYIDNKQCALIAVDEILNLISEYTIEPIVFDIKYWQEVKSEIEKLQ
jgi:hypothetical protein